MRKSLEWKNSESGKFDAERNNSSTCRFVTVECLCYHVPSFNNKTRMSKYRYNIGEDLNYTNWQLN